MNLGENQPDPPFGREVIRVYRFPIVMFALAIIHSSSKMKRERIRPGWIKNYPRWDLV